MYNQIKKIIKYYYDLDVDVVNALEDKYILSTGHYFYQLITIHRENEHLLKYHSKYLPKIIYTIFYTLSFKYRNQTYCLCEYIIPTKVISINQYISTLYLLTEETLLTQKVDEHFYQQQCEMFQKTIEETYQKFEKIIDEFIYGHRLNVMFFPLIYEYDLVNQMKQIALDCLGEYKKIVQNKTSCRVCLAPHKYDYTNFSVERNCLTNLTDIQTHLVEHNVLHLVKNEYELDDIERLFLSKIHFQEDEKLRLIVQLLCIDTIDFSVDGYKNIVWFSWLKNYISKINKIMKLLQINLNIMYN